MESNDTNEFPEPLAAPDAMMDVGRTCDICDRNIGLFPVSSVCGYCRPMEQDNGDTITGIAYSPVGTNEYRRLQTNALSINKDNQVTIVHGPHKKITWLDGPPELSSDGDSSFMLGTLRFPPPTFWVRFA